MTSPFVVRYPWTEVLCAPTAPSLARLKSAVINKKEVPESKRINGECGPSCN